ncbi:MAG: hypothetical protein R3215_07725 [Halomonas sp.]|nr:hypothetical protein [Halomonas sp.]
MSRDEAIAVLNDQWAQGDMDSDQYHMERQRIEYEHGEQQSAMERQEVVA